MGTFGIDLTSLTGTTGIDVNSLVSQLSYAARAPERVWQAQQQGLQVQIKALGQLNTGISSLLDKINSLKDHSGGLGSVVTTSSNAQIVTAAATPGATISSHVVVVNNLASTASWYSDPQTSGDATLNPGSFTVQVGTGTPKTFTIDSTNDTLNKLAASINTAALGVTATVTTDVAGARLSLVANSSGSASNIAVTSDTSGLGLVKAASGVDASLTVDGVPIKSASNTVTGVIPNLSFTLNGQSPTTQVTIGVAPDTDSAVQAVTDFVDAYNAVMETMTNGFKVDQSAQTAGAFVGDTSAAMMQQQLLDMGSYSVAGAGAFTTLRSIGITMNNDGTLSVDATAVKNAATSDYKSFQNFFQSTDGFASFFGKQLMQATDPTQGVLYLDSQGRQATQQSLQKQIDDFEQNLLPQQQQWQKQYEQANIILQQLPQLEKQIQIQLGFYSTSNK